MRWPRSSWRVPVPYDDRLGLYYTDQGEGPPVVLVHGFGLTHEVWAEQLPLADEFRLIAYDTRGCGDSVAPATGYGSSDLGDELTGLLDHLGVTRAHLVGHSRGGGVIMDMALRRPERVASLVFVSSGLGGFPYSEAFLDPMKQCRRLARDAGGGGGRRCVVGGAGHRVDGAASSRGVRPRGGDDAALFRGRLARRGRVFLVRAVGYGAAGRGAGAHVRPVGAGGSARLRRDRQHADLVDPGSASEVAAGRWTLPHAREPVRDQPLPAGFPAQGGGREGDVNDFEEFGLSAPVLESIHKMGFVEASPIQKKAIPLILEGRDLLGQAQTGTGKTAAFGIPMAERLAADAPHVGALVLCPTRELAVQVAEELHELCLFSGQKVLPIYGGQRIDRQITALKKGVQVVVGTPGRILDHLGRRTLDLSGVQLLVLDEADMMLDMGFLPDIRRILRQCPTDRQTMLFSATIPDDIRRISQEYMRNPESISVVPETLTLEDTEQIFYEVPEEEKIDALMRLLDYEGEEDSVIIFCRTRRNVDKLTRKLKSRGYDVEGLHGDLTQQQRDQIMQGFREQKFAYLVATDVASRGLDISHVTRVINFHIPQDPEAYVHRIGRTGRMGRSGVAITFVTPAEYWDLLRIQEFSMAQIEQGELPSSGEVEERRRAAAGDLTARRKVREADRAPGRSRASARSRQEEAIIELTLAGREAMAGRRRAVGDESLGTPLGSPVESDEETPQEPSRRRRRAGAGAAKDAGGRREGRPRRRPPRSRSSRCLRPVRIRRKPSGGNVATRCAMPASGSSGRRPTRP